MLRSVERALADLRRGRAVAISGGGGRARLVLAAEGATAESLRMLSETPAPPRRSCLTARRAAVVGLARIGLRAIVVAFEGTPAAEMVQALADPLSSVSEMPHARRRSQRSCGVFLRKRGSASGEDGPAAAGGYGGANPRSRRRRYGDWASRHGLLLVDAGDIFQYDFIAARTLKPVSEARVPLLGAENARIIAFRPLDGGLEHLAVIIGEPPPPARS